MKSPKLISQIVAAAALVGFAASPAFAGTCQTTDRPFPTAGSGGQDAVTMTCKHKSNAAAGVTTGLVGVFADAAGGHTSAQLTVGAAGTSATVEAIDSAGNVISSCRVTDTTTGGGGQTLLCSAFPVKWRGFIQYIE